MERLCAISYYILISASSVLFNSTAEMFSSKLLQVIAIDVVGILFMLVFLMVDRHVLLKHRKLKFVPLRLRK